MLGSADPAPPGESQRSLTPTRTSFSVLTIQDFEFGTLPWHLVGTCIQNWDFFATRGESALTPTRNSFSSSCYLQLEPLAINMNQPFRLKNKCASVLGIAYHFVYFPTSNTMCIWRRSINSFPLQGPRKLYSINIYTKKFVDRGFWGNPGDVQTACLLFMLLPPKLRPMRTC